MLLWNDLHVESESHFGFHFAGEQLYEVVDERQFGYELVVVRVEQSGESVADDPWQIAIGNKCQSINFLVFHRL